MASLAGVGGGAGEAAKPSRLPHANPDEIGIDGRRLRPITYKGWKTASEALVADWRWASDELFFLTPFEAERHGEKPSKWLDKPALRSALPSLQL